MSAPEEEGGQDYDDILGFPGDGFRDKDDVEPDETRARDLDAGDAPMDETGAACGQGTAKKHKKSDVFPPDDFVTDRIKTLKKNICGVKCEDNEWTALLREKNGVGLECCSPWLHSVCSQGKQSIPLSGFVLAPKDVARCTRKKQDGATSWIT